MSEYFFQDQTTIKSLKSKLKETSLTVRLSQFIFPMACSECKFNYEYYCCHEKNKLIDQSDQGIPDTIQCSNCKDWKHFVCIDNKPVENSTNSNSEDLYLCESCKLIGKLLDNQLDYINPKPRNFLFHLLIFD